MRRPISIARQASAPKGLVGRLLLRVMARETTRFNNEVLRALAIEDGDSVLEVGFGHGQTLATAASRAPNGTFAGLDISVDALRVARRRCRRAIEEGRMDLRVGDAGSLPWPDASFAKVFTVHTIYFWSDPLGCLRELRRVLRPAGRCVIGFRERSEAAEASFPSEIYRLYASDQVKEMLTAVGLDAGVRRADTADHFWIATGV
jgi:ubiquinone/menaquinone biosynthesis C-methylase UbiE